MKASLQALLAALWLCGCTLGFDTGSVPFEAEGAPDEGDASPDLVVEDQRDEADNSIDPPDFVEDFTEDTPEDLPKVVEGLGLRCGIDEEQFCLPDTEAWPDCAALVCERALGEGALCLRNSQSLYGYCSRRCERASDCVGDPRDPFLGSMRCVEAPGGQSVCMPGSQGACGSSAQCPEGESCKQVYDETQTIAEWRCQAKTPLGAAPGGFCNEDPRRGLSDYVQRCADDNCVDDVCMAWCEPGQGDEVCQSANLRCRDLSELGGEEAGRGMCSERSCGGPSECEGEGVVCAPQREDAQAGPTAPGHCRVDNPRSRGNLRLGETCGELLEPDPDRCASRYCVGYPPYYYCSALCEEHADCGAGMLCVVASLGEEPERFTKVCAYAPGSQELCSDGGGCSDREEVCAPYLFGEVSEDAAGVRGAVAEGRCVARTPNSVPEGNVCGGASCEVPGACVGSPATCTRVCGDSFDCPFLQFCVSVLLLSADAHVDGGAVTLGFCL